MITVGSTWVMVLRCADCKSLFTLNGIPDADIVRTPDVTACPHCGCLPNPISFAAPRHLITSLKKEKTPN
jgi:hypothetical protein